MCDAVLRTLRNREIHLIKTDRAGREARLKRVDQDSIRAGLDRLGCECVYRVVEIEVEGFRRRCANFDRLAGRCGRIRLPQPEDPGSQGFTDIRGARGADDASLAGTVVRAFDLHITCSAV